MIQLVQREQELRTEDVKNRNGRGYIISYLNGTAAYGFGATTDLGMAIDAKGESRLYFKLGVTGGLGTSVGTGATVTNKGYNVDDIAGESIDGNVTLPFFKGLFSLDLFGNSNKLGLSNVGDVWPGANTRGIGLNAGVGTGAFVNWTYTFVTPVPEINNKYIYFSTYGH